MILALIAALAVASTLTFHACAHAWLRRRPPDGPASPPPVSILKPLRGVDDGLYENLASLAAQDHPAFEIVLGAESPNDPALEVARRITRDFPQRDIRVVAGAPGLGYNPKVTNLASLSAHARHDVWLVSDSNVRVRMSYLREITAELCRPGAGMVCNVFAGRGERSLGALFENLHLNSWIPGGMCAAQLATGQACVTGKSMLFHKSVLERVGGWQGVKDVLAEDYVLGRRFAALGLKVVTSRHVIDTVNTSWTLRRFLNRHLRWATIRRTLALPAYALEPLLNPVPFGLALVVAGQTLAGLAVVGVKVVSDAVLARRVRGSWYAPWHLLAIPLKDLVIAGIWAVGFFRRHVWWRGHRLVVNTGTVISKPPPRRARDPEAAVGPPS